jgi:dihydrofolate reductase
MTVTLVVAMSRGGVIGADGGIPWHLPADLQHFKRLTLGHPMVMGRATFDSIGRALPGRTTIVVTRQPDWTADGVLVAGGVREAIDLGRGLDDEVFLVGGAQVYAQALEAGLVDRLVVSRVDVDVEGDTHFPDVDWAAWPEVARDPHDGFVVTTHTRT